MKGENGPRDDRTFENTNNDRSTFLRPGIVRREESWSEKAVDDRRGCGEKRPFNVSPAMKRSEK
jgi:hypothetical protein